MILNVPIDGTVLHPIIPVSLLYEFAKKFCQLIDPCRFFIWIKGPLISKLKPSQVRIVIIIKMPECNFTIPGNFCKVAIAVLYAIVFKTYWYRIHGLKIKSDWVKKKGLLISILPLSGLD